MKRSSANILLEGKREIRAIGDVCDPSCFTWYACAHSKPNGVCDGFILMNGETRKHLNRILDEDDAIYVQECMRMIQNGSNEEELIKEVLRFIPHEEPQRQSGFSFMARTALGVSNVSTQQRTEPEPPSSEFTRMLAASSKHQHTTAHPVERQNLASIIQRQNSFDFENQIPLICGETCPIIRHCSSWPSNAGNTCIKHVTPNRSFIHKEQNSQ